jgi:hypothetical protein
MQKQTAATKYAGQTIGLPERELRASRFTSGAFAFLTRHSAYQCGSLTSFARGIMFSSLRPKKLAMK